MDAENQIRTEPQPNCIVCGAPGSVKYRGLTDRLFSAPSSWTVKQCDVADCGSLWLDPRPILADIGKAYSHYYTHSDNQQQTLIKRAIRALALEVGDLRYGFRSSRLPWPGKYLAAATVALYPGLREHLDLQIRYLPSSSMGNGRLLDVGCGDGEALEILRELGWDVVGVEFDPRAVVVARKRKLDVREGTLSDAAFPDETFDALSSSHVIEHLHDPLAFLAESRRVLRPGGALVAISPNAQAWTHEKHGAHWLNLDAPRHLVLFTANSLRNLAKSAGFRNVQVSTTTRAIALTEIASSKIREEGHYEWGKWPGFRTWIRAQAMQSFAPSYMKSGRIQGDELVLLAIK